MGYDRTVTHPANSQSRGWREALRRVDEEYSGRLHRCCVPAPVEAALLVPCLLFSSFGIPFLIAVLMTISPWHLARVFIAGSLVTLALIIRLKKVFGRPRPSPSIVLDGGHRPLGRRFRGMENNCAMPSGDAAQCAMWLTTFLRIGGPFFRIGGPFFAFGDDDAFVFSGFIMSLLALLVMLSVMFARVFFGFHWRGLLSALLLRRCVC